MTSFPKKNVNWSLWLQLQEDGIACEFHWWVLSVRKNAYLGAHACKGDGERGGGKEQSEEMVETLRVQQGVWQMHLAVGRAALSLGWYRLCNAPMASRWYRHHHTQGGCSKGVTALLTAELEFGLRILPLPPSQQPLPIDRCWRSRG